MIIRFALLTAVLLLCHSFSARAESCSKKEVLLTLSDRSTKCVSQETLLSSGEIGEEYWKVDMAMTDDKTYFLKEPDFRMYFNDKLGCTAKAPCLIGIENFVGGLGIKPIRSDNDDAFSESSVSKPVFRFDDGRAIERESCSGDVQVLMFGRDTGMDPACVEKKGERKLIQEMSDLIDLTQKVANECIQHSMQSHQRLYERKVCTGKDQSKAIAESPCVSEESIGKTAALLNGAAACTGLDPNYLFPLFNHESSFYPNAVSGTGASCYGQMTEGAVAEVTRIHGGGDGIKKKMKEMNSECPIFAGKAQSVDTDDYHQCSLLSSPETCMAYSVLYQKELRDRASKVMAEYEGRFTSPDEILDLLGWWSHNGGPSVFQQYFRDFMDGQTGKISTKDFNRDFQKFLRDNYAGKNSRKAEVAGFVGKVSDDFGKIKRMSGGRCAPLDSTISKIGI